jgi:putative Ca2+/H+ antiporter (TMEM165/GDT1 family)
MNEARLFFSVFAVVFVAELPDKTTLTALVLATRHRALPVFIGAALALGIQSAIAVLAGSLLARLPPHPVRIGAGIVFLASAVVMWRRRDEPAPAASGEGGETPGGAGRAAWTAFVMVFIAELGDLTQLATAGFAARGGRPAIVFAGSAAALWTVSALAIFVGNRAGRFLNPRLTHTIAAALFAAVGIALIAGVM